MHSREELVSLLALKQIPGLGDVTVKLIIAGLGSAKEAITASKSKLKKLHGIGEVTAQVVQLHKRKALDWAENQLELCQKNDITIITQDSEFYPDELKKNYYSPVVLFAKGNVKSLQKKKMVAVVGTRKATSYGKKITEEICNELVQNNIVIVSGLAYGIDITAHRAALKENGFTIAVLGGGLQSIYPAEHKNIAEEIKIKGCLVSEYPFGTQPDPKNFPERNRILAALSQAIIVVEAAEKGGALITAQYANEYNKEVYAVPGKIGDPYSVGCLQLIKNHKANLFTSTSEMLKELNWSKINASIEAQNTIKTKAMINLSDSEKIVYNILLSQGATGIDELAWKAKLNLNELANILLKLEFLGIVKAKPGKKFEIV